MSDSEPKTLMLGGYAQRYLESGAGELLLLVHGSLCDCRYWRPQMQPLALRRRVVAVSLRRYWPEAWDGGGEGFSLQQHADDLAALIEALGAGPAHLVGHSRGGSVAWRLAQQRPELLRSLTLAEPGLCLDDAGAGCGAADLDRGGFRQRALQRLSGGDADGALELFIDTVSGGGTWARMVPWIRRMMRDNAATLFGQVQERYDTVAAAALRSLPMPLLLVGGALSPQPYPRVLDALAAMAPAARRVSVPAASHAMNLWNAAAFNQILLAFLDAA
jgi:pimeloyl-ACP methyl ester carboxylesterase